MVKYIFNCLKYDRYLHDVMVTIQSYFIVNKIDIEFEESKTENNNFFYHITNKENNLEGYIGRNKDDKKIIYLIKDKSRISYGIKEGFINDNNVNLLEIYDKLNIIRKLNNIQSFINFISGKKEYYFDTIEKKKS